MFQDSLVESSGRLKTRSSRYMGITGAFNAAVVATMMVVPLLYPEALPKTAMLAMVSAPPPPPGAPAQPPRVTVVKAVKAAVPMDPLVAPNRAKQKIDMRDDPPVSIAGAGSVAMSAVSAGGSGPMGAIGLDPPLVPLVKVMQPRVTGPAKISSGVIAGNKLSGSSPMYPAIAKAAHVSGAVVMRAVISKAGTIESLSVVSGHDMLRASAVAAVQEWRYKPYLLNGEATEVETTITVNFSFGG